LLTSFLNNLTKIDVGSKLFDLNFTAFNESISKEIYFNNTIDTAIQIYKYFVEGMIDITVNGTLGDVDPTCRPEPIDECLICRISDACRTCLYGDPFSVTYKINGTLKMFGLCECP